MENNALQHHGIKGMRWGKRRYQNPDGTLTTAGKKRYKAEMDKLKAEEQTLKNKQRTQAKINKLLAKRQELDDMKKNMSGKGEETAKNKNPKPSDPEKPKGIKDMTNEEILAKIERIRLEQTLKALTPQEKTRGEKFVDNFLKPNAKKWGDKLSDTVLEKVNKEIRKKFGVDVEDELGKLKKEAEKAGYKKTIAEAKAAIKKANDGEPKDFEMDRLKRESEMAGYRMNIRKDKRDAAGYNNQRQADLRDAYNKSGEKYTFKNKTADDTDNASSSTSVVLSKSSKDNSYSFTPDFQRRLFVPFRDYDDDTSSRGESAVSELLSGSTGQYIIPAPKDDD